MYGATQRVRTRNSGSSVLNKVNYSESMTDWVVPEFTKLRDRGVLLNHPMDKWRCDTASWPGQVTVTKQQQRVAWPRDIIKMSYTTYKKRFYYAPLQGHPGWVNAARTLYIADMVDRGIAFPGDSDIRQAITEVSSRIGSGCAQIWVTFAEFRKTIGMLCKALRLLRTPIKDALRALGTTLKEALATQRSRIRLWKKACDLWLEIRYGWRPFIYDAMALWDANVRAGSANHRLTKVKVVDNNEVALLGHPWFSYESIFPTAAYAAVDIRLQRYVKTGQTADFNAMVTGPARVFGAYDIVGTAWELIPFSWVVDKFINLGNVAQALQAALLVDERIGWVSKIELASVSWPYTVVKQPGPIEGSGWIHTYVSDSLNGPATGEDLETYKVSQRLVVEDFTPVLGIEGKLDFLEYLDLLALFRKLRKV